MINIIVAIDNKNGFAKNNIIPWYYTEDFQHFRKLTMNNICVMGRNTYEEIDIILSSKKPSVLPGRICFVLSNTLDELPNAQVIKSMDEFKYVLDTVEQLKGKDIFFIGGKQLYDLALEFADNVYVTHINKDYDCDVFFNMDYVYNNYPVQYYLPSTNDELTFKIYSKHFDLL